MKVKTEIIIPKNTCIFCLQIRTVKKIDESCCDRMALKNICFAKMKDDNEVLKRIKEYKNI